MRILKDIYRKNDINTRKPFSVQANNLCSKSKIEASYA